MSIISKKLGNAKKYNGLILEHNRHKPNSTWIVAVASINLFEYICSYHYVSVNT